MCTVNGKPLKVFEDKEGILVVRNGKAGTTVYLSKGKYTITDHAYILHLKKEYEGKVSLKWLTLQYRKMFTEYSSSSANGTWNMTGFFDKARIDIPDYGEQLEIVRRYNALEELGRKVRPISSEIDELFEKQLV
jgi:hypothetical protein